MAPRKAKSSPPTAKPRTREAGPERRANRAAVPAEAGGESSRLLREAAWSRMFGRIESKNPFAR